MTVTTAPHHASHRQALLAWLLVSVAVLIAYRDTAATMVSIWSRSETFAHAFLVPPIVAWLIWRQRETLAELEPRPCAWMLVPMAGIAVAWLIGDLASVNVVTQFAMTALLVLAVPAVLGLRIARVIAFPLGFLFFAVPFGEFLLPQLMDLTADVTVLALQATGIPVFHEGNRIVIPSGAWLVVEACSGVRYLIASLMVGTLFAYLNYRSARRRWTFVAISIVVPIVANWIRAYLIVMLGHLSGNKIAVGVDHLIYGWLFFGVVMGVLYLLGMIWHEPANAPPTASTGSAVEAAGPRRAVAFWAIAAGAAAVVLVPHLLLHTIGGVSTGGVQHLARLDGLSGGWRPSTSPLTGWKPFFQNPSVEGNSSYASNGRDVGVYIGYYRQQNWQRKLVSSENQLVKSYDRLSKASRPERASIEVGRELVTFNTVLLRGAETLGLPDHNLRVWQLYWVADRLTASDAWAKLLAVVDRLRGRGDDAAVIVIYAAEDRPGDAREVLSAFTRANLAAIVAQLRATRDGALANVATNNMPIRPRSLPE